MSHELGKEDFTFESWVKFHPDSTPDERGWCHVAVKRSSKRIKMYLGGRRFRWYHRLLWFYFKDHWYSNKYKIIGDSQ